MVDLLESEGLGKSDGEAHSDDQQALSYIGENFKKNCKTF
jgi:hypothetical protein